MTLSIVILSYNAKDLVLDCITSIRKEYQKELDAKELEVLIVDNASSNDVVDQIENTVEGLSGFTLIKSKDNLGFGRGCNLGVDNASGEFILFLNSDTKVDSKGFLEMAEYLKLNPNIGILGGKLVNFDGSIQKSVGSFLNMINFFIMLAGGERYGLLRSSPNILEKVDWVSGACMMVNKKIFNEIGRFDEKIFMYTEDMDLSFRAKNKGYDTFYYPNTKVFHKNQGSSDRAFAIVNIYKGLLYFYKKNKSYLEYRIVWLALFAKALGVYLLGRLTNNSYYIKAYGQALGIFK